MAISIDWATRVIAVPQADLTPVSGSLYELDVDSFRLALKDIEDSDEGVAFPNTHSHNTEVTLSGVTYARSFEIINGYTVTFEDVGSPYRVRCVGANHNISDVQNLNDVSLIIGNSAGLIVVTSGSGLSTEQDAKLTNVDDLLTNIEGAFNHREALRLLLAILTGKVSGAGSGTERFRDTADTKDRVVATVDSSGNRTSVTRDAS